MAYDTIYELADHFQPIVAVLAVAVVVAVAVTAAAAVVGVP